MKKIIIIILSIHFSLCVSAQNPLPNFDFENWTTASNGTDSLIDWSSSNNVVLYPVRSLYKDTSAYHGNFSANIVTSPFGFAQYTTLGILVNGKATFSYGGGGGGANVSYHSGGGTAINYKPMFLNGYYKTTAQNANNCGFAKIILTKYNTNTNQRDTTSYNEYNFSNSNSFTAFAIPLIDLKPLIIPDTITMIFYSSNPNTYQAYSVFSNLYIDNISLSPNISTNIQTIQATKNELKVYPNPNQGKFYIQGNHIFNSTIEIYNSIGTKIKTVKINRSEEVEVNIEGYPAGIYYIKNNHIKDYNLKIIKSD